MNTDKEVLLFNLNETVRHEPRFQHLRTVGINFVPGEGDYNADVMVLGEAPGATENTLRKPFVGTCGTVLLRIFQTADLKRSELYITNVLKFRPPENRKPLVFELQKALEYVAAEIRIIDPKVIVALGNTAFNVFYPLEKITNAEGVLRVRNNRIIIPTFHPGAILRDRNKQKRVVHAFQEAKAAAANYDKILSESRL